MDFISRNQALAIALVALAVPLFAALMRGLSYDRWDIPGTKRLRLGKKRHGIGRYLFDPGYSQVHEATERAMTALGWRNEWAETDVFDAKGRTDAEREAYRRKRNGWLYLQRDVVRSPGVEYYESGFLFWVNVFTAAVLFAAAVAVTWFVHWWWPSLLDPAADWGSYRLGAFLLAAGLLAWRSYLRMWAYFRNYMRHACIVIERFVDRHTGRPPVLPPPPTAGKLVGPPDPPGSREPPG